MSGSRPIVLSDRQGFDRRWFAPNLQAELVAEMPETDFSLLKLNHVSNGQIGLILQMVSAPRSTGGPRSRRPSRSAAPS